MNGDTWMGRFLISLFVLGGFTLWISLAFWLYSFTPFGCIAFLIVSMAVAIATID